ncbi:unnamed protein product, partial [Musa banksii]
LQQVFGLLGAALNHCYPERTFPVRLIFEQRLLQLIQFVSSAYSNEVSWILLAVCCTIQLGL